MDQQTILVTGANGFIGSNLVKMLLEHGYAVISLDCAPVRRAYPGFRCTVSREAAEDGWDLLEFQGDVRDTGLLDRIFQYQVDYVVHLAARSTIQLGAENAAETMSVNVGGTEALLRAAAGKKNLRGFLFASTDKVYGSLQGQAYTETDALAPVDSPYDRSKAAADQLVRKWSQAGRIPGVVLRFCNIYGPYDLQTARIIPGSIRAVLEGRDCVLRMYRGADGRARNFQRDFLYVDDLCQTIWRVLETLDAQGAAFPAWGEAFNLGAQRCYPIDKVIQTIQALLGSERPPKVELAGALAEIPEQRMNWSKAAAAFGFLPKTTLEDGIAETITWWRRYLGIPAEETNREEEYLP